MWSLVTKIYRVIQTQLTNIVQKYPHDYLPTNKA